MDKHDHHQDPTGHGYPLADFLDDNLVQKIRGFFERAINSTHADHHATRATEFEDPAKPVDLGTDRLFQGKATGFGNGESVARALQRYFRDLRLCRFNGSTDGNRTQFTYDLGFRSPRRVGILLNNPMDTVLSFGGEPYARPDPTADLRRRRLEGFVLQTHLTGKKLDEPLQKIKKAEGESAKSKDFRTVKRPPLDPRTPECDLNLRFIVDSKGSLRVLQIFGSSVRIHFSRRLIKPVRKNSLGRYVPLGGRISAGLEHRVITLARWQPPRISEPLDCGDVIVQVSGRKMIVKLGSVTLGGSFAAPRLIFNDIEMF